jgi:hypothetical protein
MSNKRLSVSVILAVILLGMAVTGILSYLLPYGATLSGFHTWFGLLFLIAIVLHLTNNGRTLWGYLKKPTGKKFLMAGLSGGLALMLGVGLSLPPFSSLLETGLKLRKTAAIEEGKYQTITTHSERLGQAIQIDLRAGKNYQSEPQPLFLGLSYRSTPQAVFWLEDMEGNYLDTLYVTKKITHAGFRLSDDIFSKEIIRRPEALPYWAHKRGRNYGNGQLMPGSDNTDLDGVTAATPQGHYDIESVAAVDQSQFRVLMEINRSYDFNDFYHKERFPNDPVYSGSGSSGQPSVIYQVEIDSLDGRQVYIMKAIGHGHHSGANGTLYRDMSGIDSALQLVDRVIVSL